MTSQSISRININLILLFKPSTRINTTNYKYTTAPPPMHNHLIDHLTFNRKRARTSKGTSKSMSSGEQDSAYDTAEKYLKYMVMKCPIELYRDEQDMIGMMDCRSRENGTLNVWTGHTEVKDTYDIENENVMKDKDVKNRNEMNDKDVMDRNEMNENVKNEMIDKKNTVHTDNVRNRNVRNDKDVMDRNVRNDKDVRNEMMHTDNMMDRNVKKDAMHTYNAMNENVINSSTSNAVNTSNADTVSTVLNSMYALLTANSTCTHLIPQLQACLPHVMPVHENKLLYIIRRMHRQTCPADTDSLTGLYITNLLIGMLDRSVSLSRHVLYGACDVLVSMGSGVVVDRLVHGGCRLDMVVYTLSRMYCGDVRIDSGSGKQTGDGHVRTGNGSKQTSTDGIHPSNNNISTNNNITNISTNNNITNISTNANTNISTNNNMTNTIKMHVLNSMTRTIARECKKHLSDQAIRMLYTAYTLHTGRHDIDIFTYCHTDEERAMMRAHGGTRRVFRACYYHLIRHDRIDRILTYHSRHAGTYTLNVNNHNSTTNSISNTNSTSNTNNNISNSNNNHNSNTNNNTNGNTNTNSSTTSSTSRGNTPIDDLICIACNSSLPSLILTLKERISVIKYVLGRIDKYRRGDAGNRIRANIVRYIHLLNIHHYRDVAGVCASVIGSDRIVNECVYAYMVSVMGWGREMYYAYLVCTSSRRTGCISTDRHTDNVSSTSISSTVRQYFMSGISIISKYKNDIRIDSRDGLRIFCYYYITWCVRQYVPVDYKYFYTYLSDEHVIDTMIVNEECRRSSTGTYTNSKYRDTYRDTYANSKYIHANSRDTCVDVERLLAWLRVDKLSDRDNVPFYTKLLFMLRMLGVDVPNLSVIARIGWYDRCMGWFVGSDDTYDDIIDGLNQYNDYDNGCNDNTNINNNNGCDGNTNTNISNNNISNNNISNTNTTITNINNTTTNTTITNNNNTNNNISITNNNNISISNTISSSSRYAHVRMYKMDMYTNRLIAWMYAHPYEQYTGVHIDRLVRTDMLAEWLTLFYNRHVIRMHSTYLMSRPHVYVRVLARALADRLVLADTCVPALIAHFKAPWFIMQYEHVILRCITDNVIGMLTSDDIRVLYQYMTGKRMLVRACICSGMIGRMDGIDRGVVRECVRDVMKECNEDMYETLYEWLRMND